MISCLIVCAEHLNVEGQSVHLRVPVLELGGLHQLLGHKEKGRFSLHSQCKSKSVLNSRWSRNSVLLLIPNLKFTETIKLETPFFPLRLKRATPAPQHWGQNVSVNHGSTTLPVNTLPSQFQYKFG